ncbi:hypothetical protein KHA94_00370 [Bacillus sp. FJAT-49705]|uniref:DUF6906 domain-containing protein n=1 Tax=Cytobacillus citreus TaxID=2833586 RepID=A0ABS5NP10_9BACI|nr:hypothetical protein [Cytobacillus citreus]MBS4188674.1 hypothetical protein [Cytobacillus citreus]
MKAGKRPTRNQKKAVFAAGLNPANWLVFKNINGQLHLVHREEGTVKIIPSNM